NGTRKRGNSTLNSHDTCLKLVDTFRELEVSTYIPERKQAGKRNWDGKQSEQQAVEANQSRVTGEYGKELLRKRGELVERSFAHCYETGAMRRCTLRGHENILKRLLIHIGAFNISLILRTMLGAGKPRELKNRAAMLVLRLFEWLTCRYRPNGSVESSTTPILALSGTDRSGKPQYRFTWIPLL
ncbi:MAG: transposase, partial [Acidobacteriaceae bacterium]